MTLRVKEVAKSKGIKLKDLAEQLRIDRVSLSRIINGNPTVKTLEKIADALDVDVKDLFISTKGQDDPLAAFEKIREIAENQLHRRQ